MAGSLIYFGLLGFIQYPIVVPCRQSQIEDGDATTYRSRSGWDREKIKIKRQMRKERKKTGYIPCLLGIHYIHSNRRAKYYVVTDR